MATSLPRKFKTEVLLSITTGKLLCQFGEMQECCEFLAETPIFTHQFAYEPFMNSLKQAVLCQFPEMGHVDAEQVNRTNWVEFRDRMIEQFGPELQLVPLRLCSEQDFADSFNEPLKGKRVVAIEV